MSVSVEIVPRSEDFLKESLELLCQNFSQVDMINIPDLLRFPLRSWQSCGLAKDYFQRRIPHIRSIDFDLANLTKLIKYLEANFINEILIIKGDIPKGKQTKGFFITTPVELIKALKISCPNLKIYAGLDPYRWSVHQEIDYCFEKIEAGVVGFFTQPFFDLGDFMTYRHRLPNTDFFLGVSPVLELGSQRYWENINNVVFPRSFSPTKDWNGSFAHDAMQLVAQENLNIYFMPIKIDFLDYFSRVFNH